MGTLRDELDALREKIEALEERVDELENGEGSEGEDETDEDESEYTNLVLHDAICESRDDIVGRVERRADRILKAVTDLSVEVCEMATKDAADKQRLADAWYRIANADIAKTNAAIDRLDEVAAMAAKVIGDRQRIATAVRNWKPDVPDGLRSFQSYLNELADLIQGGAFGN